MKIAIHTAHIRIGPEDQVIIGSLEKGDVIREVKEFKRLHPDCRVKIESTLEDAR